MTGDDQADTEMGLSADAPTQFRNPVPIEVQQAWSVDDGLGEPYPQRASWRRIVALTAAIVVGAAVVVGGIIGWDQYKQHPAPAPAPAPVVAEPPPAPEPPPSWHLNGSYRMEIRNPEGTVRNGADGSVTTMSNLGVPTATVWMAYETDCIPTECTARSVSLDDVTHQNADGDQVLFRWNGIEWESTGGGGPDGGRTRALKCSGDSGSDTLETWATMSPLPDGSFRGTFHRTTVKAECVGSLPGDQQDVPMAAVRIGDVPPGIFDK